ncbi:phage baseplate assembly protein V [Streptomyces sp. NPDC006197]|uniref:phage baseplate assembly protein V n=1 Tax=Streptomyces sp. NPDC006197 TaxID=3156685 RepID=UPI0033ACAC85
MTLERVVADLTEQIERRYYGKYRGIVVDHKDPARLGRLRLRVPSLLGPDVVTGWATPCLPFGGAADQGFLFVPERNASVWVEFEEGDLEFPIWVGTFWTSPDAETQLPRPQSDDGSETTEVQDPPIRKIIKTAKGHTIQFEDADGKEAVLVREGVQGHLVRMDGKGVTITDKRRNTIRLSGDGIEVEENNGNTLRLSRNGVEMKDSNGSAIRMAGSGMTLTSAVSFTIDASGQNVTIIADGINLTKG